MHITKTVFAFFFLGAVLLSGCSASKTYKDGTYRAEFQNFDSRGYKDYITVAVEDSAVTSISYNAVAEDGSLKNDDEKYQKGMDAVQGTSPVRFSQDLVNQYLETHNIEDVDAVSGATYSSESFILLFKALESQMASGNTETLVVQNTAEK